MLIRQKFQRFALLVCFAGFFGAGSAELGAVSVKATADGEAAENVKVAKEGGAHAGDSSAVAEAFDFNEVVSHHLMDGPPVIQIDFKIPGLEFVDLSVTRRILAMWFVSATLIILLTIAARRIASDPMRVAGRFSNAVESMVNFVRHDIIEAQMGHHGHGFEPYILTIFFFVLGCNLVGLFPSAGETIELARGLALGSFDAHSQLAAFMPSITPTGEVGVNATLATITFVLIWATGFRYQGPAYIVNIVPKGVPLALAPLMWIIEFINPLAKSFSLTIRLLANMTAGHVVILALLGLIFQYENALIGFGAVPAAVGIYLLEFFVAFLQAYIFTLLTSMFIGSAFHRH